MRAFILILATIVLTSNPATADINVEPDPYDPEIRVEVTVPIEEPEEGNTQADYPVPDDPPQLPPDYSGQCQVDEVVGTYGCPDVEPDPLGRPPITEGDIRRAVEEIGLPRLEVQVQPASTTLVNVPTIFSTEPEEFDHSVFLLGYNIDLVAEPLQFDWRCGDGTTSSSAKPGRPYPAMDVTHAYLWPALDLRPSVDVTYRVTYRVDGGFWRTLSETITADGPAVELDVAEAVPVLAKR